MSFSSDTVRDALLTVMAISTFGTAIITGWSKRAQRLREEKKAKLDAVAAEVKTKFDKAVADKVEEVKRALEESTTKSTKAICEVKDELELTHGQVNKVHTIVNSEKTAGMEELRTSRLLTLTAFKSLLATNPGSKNLQEAVAAAQALYDKINKETINKIATDDLLKQE